MLLKYVDCSLHTQKFPVYAYQTNPNIYRFRILKRTKSYYFVFMVNPGEAIIFKMITISKFIFGHLLASKIQNRKVRTFTERLLIKLTFVDKLENSNLILKFHFVPNLTPYPFYKKTVCKLMNKDRPFYLSPGMSAYYGESYF